MPTISKIRLTNVVFEEGNKRYNDELFLFDGHNGAILLENGGGKTVLIQTALQAILPHVDLADRKIKKTLSLENAPAHIAIEWIINDSPRRYVVTCVSLYMIKNGLDSLRYVYEYDANDPDNIEEIPFVRVSGNGKRTADRGEMQDYFSNMKEKSFQARTFPTIKDYKTFLEKEYQIISSQWESVVKINSTEGGVEAFFDDCKTTNQLFDRLLISTVEKSISGHEETMFADMFEKQHTSFKNYKKLKDTITENKQIQDQLESYTASFEQLHNVQLDYLETKQKVKGIWETIFSQKNYLINEKNDLNIKVADWGEQELRTNVKKASYYILIEAEKLTDFEQVHKRAFLEQSEIEETLTEYEKDCYSLQLAELRGKVEDESKFIEQLQKELAVLTEKVDLSDIEEQLLTAKQELLGYFLKKGELLEAAKSELRFELNPLERRRDEAKVQGDQLVQTAQQKRDLLSQLKSRIETRKEDSNKLRQQLLANPDQELVETELENWKNREQWLDEEMIRLQQEEKRLGNESEQLEISLETYRDKKVTVEKQKDKLILEQDLAKDAHDTLVTKLAERRPQWSNLDNIYLKQQSIETTLKERIETKTKERQTLLYKERVAYRFVDDYLEQDHFFGDPFLEQQIKSWKNQFELVTTGVEYLQLLDEEDRQAKLKFRLWPLTLITTNKSKPELLKKLTQVEDRLLFPIVVLTMEEAKAIEEGKNLTDWVAPKHWNQNLNQNSFSEWRKEIENQALQTRKAREESEVVIDHWQTVAKEFSRFLEKYPFELEKQRISLLSQLTSEIETHKADIQTTKRLAESLKNSRDTIETKVTNYRDEKHGLETKIKDALLYLRYLNEIKADLEREKQIKQELDRLEKSIIQINIEFKRFNEECRDIETRINALDFQLTHQKEDVAYKDVQSLTPIFSDDTRTTIVEKIQNLNYKIREISQTRGELEADKRGKLALIGNYQNQIDNLVTEHPNLDENLTFPQDGSQLINLLRKKIITSKMDLKTSSFQVQKKAAGMEKQKGKYEEALKRFNKDFPNEPLIQFEEPLEDVDVRLQAETHSLVERKSYLDQEFARVKKELSNVEEAERALEKFIEGHKFTTSDIEALELTYQEKQDFTYHRLAIVNRLTSELRNRKDEVETIKQDVDKAKRGFREFCNQKITDVKMRNMALNGVEYKQTYLDILQFKKNMMISVDRATSYANEHIRQKDIELQAFINQIHSHIQTVVDELKQIPKKTKVKVNDDWKQIYAFTIPEWQEEDGKARLRDHIEWILGKLDTEQFLNEHGTEDSGKIRKEIEMWLQSKQLIRIIMNNEAMKVNCRKVTNDNKVTTRSYSWEQSNVWSGGEKWSKNMTLFLGILNYVAEKKQHLQTSMKRSRAVILDNPFGKASSDHVLSPVFFVAEQLGFQIIALTAHAEGKFLQDYFPVIYSCRLRASKDANKKVMTKEKWLHHAYFQDHEPKALDRLGENEQLALFE